MAKETTVNPTGNPLLDQAAADDLRSELDKLINNYKAARAVCGSTHALRRVRNKMLVQLEDLACEANALMDWDTTSTINSWVKRMRRPVSRY